MSTETVQWDRYEHAEEAELARLRDERLRLEGRIEGIQEALGHYRNLKRQGMLKGNDQ